jgi:hypothetical protein
MGAAGSVHTPRAQPQDTSFENGNNVVTSEHVSARANLLHSRAASHPFLDGIGNTVTGIVSDVSSMICSSIEHEVSCVEHLDILLAMKALGLCKLSYSTLSQDPEKDALQQKWLTALKIKEFQCWYDYTNDSSLHVAGGDNNAAAFDPNNLGIEAITGIAFDISDDLMGPIPFVCFRGSVDPAHVVTRKELADVISVQLDEKEDDAALEMDENRCAHLHKYKNLHQLCTTKAPLNGGAVGHDCLLDICCRRGAEYANGLLVCGHSLGGAMASLFAAEVYSNYGDAIALHLITLGAPKVFSSKTAAEINSHPYRNLRFCNNNDMVQSLGAPHHHPTGKNVRMITNNSSSNNNSARNGGVDEQHQSTGTAKRHQWVGVTFSVLRPRQHEPVRDEISVKTAICSHSILGNNGYFDNIFHSSTYQKALEKLENQEVRESYETVHELIHTEKRFHFSHAS